MTFKDGNPGVTESGRMAVWRQIKGAPNHCGWRYLNGTVVHEGTEVRPLVRIDPDRPDDVIKFVDILREHGWLAREADAFVGMAAALREYVTPKPPKPPKPAEPTGFGAVVVDDNDVSWVNLQIGRDRWRDEYSNWGNWDDIKVTSPDQIKFAGLS